MSRRIPMELLCPAGGEEQLHAAVRFGADAVYLAGPRWGMRARAVNFDDESLLRAVSYAHDAGVAVHVTLNTLMYDADLDELPTYLHFLDETGVDAIIVADLGALALVREHAPHVAVHVSTQASVANAQAALAYARLGARRIVLARELTLARIRELHRRLGDEVELEAFVHGAMCVAVSGRCLLSSALVGPDRSASCGNCTQPCRWTWSLVEETRPNAPMPLEADERGSYILSANDLCMIEHLDELAEAGVCSVKIEGRNKGAYYVAAVTNAYRHVLDGDDPGAWAGELEATSHRPFSTGFFYGNPTQNPGHAEYARDRLLVAVAQRSVPLCGNGSETGREGRDEIPILTADQSMFTTEVICRNKAVLGDMLTVLSPGQPVRRFELGKIERLMPPTDESPLPSWQPTDCMSVNMERYRFRTPFALGLGDMLCV